ncbi:MAG: TIGR02171 family protein, partial [Hallerella sp.]|nr:TIGR02171 family protein [Hallerella sp.]
AHTKIALVNTLDSSVTELVEGAELWHPDLWVGNSQNENAELDLDSAGMYLPEDYDYVQSKYRLKMELYWENLPETEILCVGSSRMEWGLNPELYPERKMFNMAVSGIDINREMYFVKNYVMRHAENLKAIVFSMDIDNYRGMRGIAEKIFAASGYVYDANHQFWENGIPKNFIEAVKEAPGDREFMKNYTQRGYIHSPSKSWGNSPVEILSDTIYTETEAVYMDQKYAEFFELVDQFAALNIYVIAIIFPQNPEYKNTGSFGRYGPQRSVAKKRIAWLDSIAKVKPNFILMDENKMGDHDYTDEMALDYDHLSYLGANQVTTRLDSVLKTLP